MMEKFDRFCDINIRDCLVLKDFATLIFANYLPKLKILQTTNITDIRSFLRKNE